MRINSVAAVATLYADASTKSAAQDEHPGANTTDHAHAGSNPFAVLGEPLLRARVDLTPDRAPTAPALSGSSDWNPEQVAKRHGIIVIGGSQAREVASTVRDAIKQGPMQRGIIIVGGSVPDHALPKVR